MSTFTRTTRAVSACLRMYSASIVLYNIFLVFVLAHDVNHKYDMVQALTFTCTVYSVTDSEVKFELTHYYITNNISIPS